MSSTAAVQAQDLRYIMATNPVCPECNLKRSRREFEAASGARFVNCINCRRRGKSVKRVR